MVFWLLNCNLTSHPIFVLLLLYHSGIGHLQLVTVIFVMDPLSPLSRLGLCCMSHCHLCHPDMDPLLLLSVSSHGGIGHAHLIVAVSITIAWTHCRHCHHCTTGVDGGSSRWSWWWSYHWCCYWIMANEIKEKKMYIHWDTCIHVQVVVVCSHRYKGVHAEDL